MDKLVPVHHSLVDWEWQAGVGFAIGNERFVSPPSALYKSTALGLPQYGLFALKQAISGNLLDGRITTYMLSEDSVHWQQWIYFRAQTSPHLAYNPDSYLMGIYTTQVTLFSFVGGALSSISSAPLDPPLGINTWYRFRLSWYTWLTPALNPVLRVQFDQYLIGVWTMKFLWDLDPPFFQTSPTNLIGFRISGGGPLKQFWIDDTEVYARFPG